MAVLKLDPTDRFAEIDLKEDSTVDARELAVWEAGQNMIRRCGFKLTVTGQLAVAGPRRPYRRGDITKAIERRRGRR